MSLREQLENLPDHSWSNDTVMFRPLKTQADLIYATYDCELTEEQKDMVNPAWFSVGRAYLFPADNYPCIICKTDGKPIGFINLAKWLAKWDDNAYTWSYYIDLKHQGKGYGKKSAQLAIEILRLADPTKLIKLATEAENSKAQSLYKSLGFKQLDELDGDDLVFGL